MHDRRTEDAARSDSGVLRMGRGEPLLLLHGVTGSARMWHRVLPLLAPHHDVIAPTALGHRGGTRASSRPVEIRHVIDDAERFIDQLGFDRVHLAGNSMGGWVALELARRGRARSVCALSPAGTWGQRDKTRATRILRMTIDVTRRSRFLLPLLVWNGAFRRFALRDSAVHGDRVAPADLIALADDLLGCEAAMDLLGTEAELAPLTPDCPVLIAWSREDRIFRVGVNGAIAQKLVPAAHYRVLDDVGHVPMMDDPSLVARTILDAVALANRESAWDRQVSA